MQKWIIPSNKERFDIVAHFEKNDTIDWEKKYNYEIGDIAYIYCSKPIGRLMFKTIIEEEIIYDDGSKGIILRLIKKVDKEELSYENLRENGLQGPIFGPRGLQGDLERYVEKFFKDTENNMWVVIAGENSVKIDTFKKNNFVGIGWNLNDLKGKSKKDIQTEYEEVYPFDSPNRAGNIVSQIFRFVKNIKIGDYIISADSPNNEYYVGKCTSEYYFSDKKDDSGIYDRYEHCHDVEWSCTKIKREDLSDNARKKLAISKSVSQIKDKNVIEELLEFVKFKPFSSKENRNIIYFGAPGTGKSYNLNIKMEELLKNHKNNYERVTFHPDYTYANFVGTYKPVPKGDSEISYEYVPGPFMRILVKALQKPSEPFVLLIEEINRANVAAVFGDVFQLLDRDKETNNSEFPINVSEDIKNYFKTALKCNQCYVKSLLGEDFDKLIIPQNMFIWATMNSADQGVFPMDTAFKRRWDFIYLGINDGAKKIENLKFKLYGKEFLWDNIRTEINKKLLEYGINEDKLIGPFFAFNEYVKQGEIPEDKFKDIFKNKILMYLFEDAARSRRDKLFSGIGDDKNKIYSDICNNFDDEKIGLRIFHNDITDKIFNEDSE